MTNRAHQISRLVEEALARPPAERGAFLQQACADSALRIEIESLLAKASAAESASPTSALAVPTRGHASATSPSLIGRRIDTYDVLSRIGAGGMGEVYLARDMRLDRRVALKILPPDVRSDADRMRRFRREARAASSLSHPNVATIYDAGEADGVSFIAMEYVEGQTLVEKIAGGPATSADVVDIGIQMADALQAAHASGVIHRDIKPANVMISAHGHVKILDFGVAKYEIRETAATDATFSVTQAGVMVGTVSYMSPEQAIGAAVDHRSDVFSLGVVLYQLATAHVPFSGSTTPEIIDRIRHAQPPAIVELNDEVPPELDGIIRTCLAKHVESRYQSAHDVLTDLRALKRQLNASPERGARSRGSAAVSAASMRRPSIAVLPFASMSVDKENEYFCDGLTEEIINVLAHLPGLKVAGRTSSFFFKGKDVEFKEIARRLEVENILEGSVRRAGNRIRVTTQLVKVADGFHLWSERYDREISDVFAIQDQIAHAIATALTLTLSPEPTMLRRRQPNVAAYEVFLKGRHWQWKLTPEAFVRSTEYLEQAIALDPEFALARAELGYQFCHKAMAGMLAAREAMPLARAMAGKALEIDPSLPEAHSVQAIVAAMFDYDWREAGRRFELAMARDPVPAFVRHRYAFFYLSPLGRAREAIEQHERALADDPLNGVGRMYLAASLQAVGRETDAIGQLQQVLELDQAVPPASSLLASGYAERGLLADALAVVEKAQAQAPFNPNYLGLLAGLLVRNGAVERSEPLLRRLQETPATYGAARGFVAFYLQTGQIEKAMDWVARAIDERDPFVTTMLMAGVTGKALRSSPRWPAVARLMNLPPAG